MSQQCGNCKWWDNDNVSTLSNGDTFAECLAPLPFWVQPNTKNDCNPLGKQGQYCDMYEERKE